MIGLLLAINLFVNPEVPHAPASSAYRIPIVEQAPPEIDRRCTPQETRKAEEFCAQYGRGTSPHLWTCSVATDESTKKLTLSVTCVDWSLYASHAPDGANQEAL